MNKFTDIELIAILRLGLHIIAADGKSDIRETIVLDKIFKTGDYDLSKRVTLLKTSKDMSIEHAMMLVKEFSLNKKKMVSAWLSSLVVADGNVHPKEAAASILIDKVCGIPNLSEEEISYYSDFFFD